MKKLFENFGLDEKEEKIFLELVRLGASPISVWAKHANTKRSTMYVYLKKFVDLGLVETFERKNVLYAKAIPVSALDGIIRNNIEELQSARAVLKTSLPKLKSLEKNSPITPKVRFYEGAAKVEIAYSHILNERSFRAYFNPKRVLEMMPTYYYKIPEMVKKNQSSAFELLVDCKEALEYQKKYQSKKHQIKIFSADILFSSDTIITDDKIFLFGYSDEDVVATEIWNTELAQTQSILFDIVWRSINI